MKFVTRSLSAAGVLFAGGRFVGPWCGEKLVCASCALLSVVQRTNMTPTAKVSIKKLFADFHPFRGNRKKVLYSILSSTSSACLLSCVPFLSL